MKVVKLIILLVVMTFPFFTLSRNVLAVSADPSPKPTKVDSFELFWPIVAGKVEGDSMYRLKIFKENIRGYLILSNLKKAEYLTFISSKRLVEFEELALSRKNFENATKTLEVYMSTHKKIFSYLDKGKSEGVVITNTQSIIEDTLNRQLTLLNYILTSVDNSQKTGIESAISFINSELDTNSELEKL
jgi:hypothetical protein